MPEPESMREQLEAAFDAEVDNEEEQEETGGSPEDSEEPIRDTEASEEEDRAEGAEELSGDEPGEEDEPSSEDDEPILDEAAAGGDEGRVRDDTPAPVSWKPAIREHWDGLPAEVKGEIQRRETEIQRGLQQAAGHKKVAEEYYQTVAPFQPFIQASNSTPAQAITELMTTAAQLTMGSPAKKAEVVRNIISEYNVDIKMLDEALAGQELPQDENAPLLNAIDERLAPINDFMGQVTDMRQQADYAVDEEAGMQVDEFAQGHEFYEDLRDDMADLMEMAANRGRSMTLEQAYERAAAAHPEIGPILTQRKAAEQGKLDGDKLRRKKDASSSIHGSPTGGRPAAKEGDMRSVMEEAWDDMEGSVGHG